VSYYSAISDNVTVTDKNMFVVTEWLALSRIQAGFDYRTLAQRIFKKIHLFKLLIEWSEYVLWSLPCTV